MPKPSLLPHEPPTASDLAASNVCIDMICKMANPASSSRKITITRPASTPYLLIVNRPLTGVVVDTTQRYHTGSRILIVLRLCQTLPKKAILVLASLEVDADPGRMCLLRSTPAPLQTCTSIQTKDLSLGDGSLHIPRHPRKYGFRGPGSYVDALFPVATRSGAFCFLANLIDRRHG
ncbi:hypothetical protein BDW22DRAFT_566890 [Trametopsis cervina]|nr:hypothetical protein BDW22DRAFT_566890 [Trametopsis cervina]